MRLAARALLMVALTFAPACGSTPTDPDEVVARSLQLTTAHFIFQYPEADASAVAAIAPAVEDRSRRIVEDLRAGGMAPVHVHYYATNSEMASAVRPIAGDIGPSVTGLVTGADRIDVLSPARTGQSSEDAIVTVLHEFAHCVTLHIDAAAGNNPRWLWETIALYEAGQRVDPRTLSYMVAGQVPTLAALSDMSNRQIYEVGFVLGEFIVELGGLGALRDLIVRHGDTAGVLGLDTAAFEARWHDFLRQRYGLS
jgi:hypothetical protein